MTSEPGPEVELTGGTANQGLVVRVGNTVRRPRRPTTPATHALLRHLEQQGLVAEFDGIDLAVAVAIPELEFRATLGHDRDCCLAMQRLRSQRRLGGRTSRLRRLGGCVSSEEAEASKSDTSGACQHCHGSFPFGV